MKRTDGVTSINQKEERKMKALASKSVFYNSTQYEAGSIIECNERDFEKILKPLGCSEYKEVKTKSSDRAIKKVKERDGSGD